MMNTALTPDSYRLFDELCDLSAEERGAFLEERVSDLDLRRKLKHMLEHFEQASLGLGGLPEVDTSGAYPEQIGPYAVKGVLGTYQDDAVNYHGSDSFSNSELLRIAHLATRAYDRISELRVADAESRKAL